MPKNLVSNYTSLFTSKFWSILCYYFKAKYRLSTTFHPQTNKQTKYQNQILEHYLHYYYFFEQDDWVLHLSIVKFTYNKVKYSSMSMLFFEALYTYNLDLCVNIKDNIFKEKVLAAQEQVKEIQRIQKLLKKNLTKIIK